LRTEVKKGSSLGKAIQKTIETGKLVDNPTMLELLNANCDFNKSSYILDGYPRNIDQVKALNQLDLVKHKFYALYFDVNMDALQKRIVNRRSCKKCSRIFNLAFDPPKHSSVCDSCGGELIQRSDDTEEVVKKRMTVYNSTITPVLDYYRGRKVLIEVNASKTPNEVYAELKEKLKMIL